jgi:hypothetical protein
MVGPLVAVFHETKTIVQAKMAEHFSAVKSHAAAHIAEVELLEADHRGVVSELKTKIDEQTEQIAALGRDLTTERENLNGCPKITLRHPGSSPYENFYVHNGGTDGIEVKLDPLESSNYVLTSNVIQHLDEGGDEPLILNAEPKSPNEKRGLAQSAWFLYVTDVWTALHPHPTTPGIDQADEAAQVKELARLLNLCVGDMIDTNLTVAVSLSYKDMVGNCYTSPAVVVWNELGNCIEEIRPKPIKKVAS